jgi:hypothetical protein
MQTRNTLDKQNCVNQCRAIRCHQNHIYLLKMSFRLAQHKNNILWFPQQLSKTIFYKKIFKSLQTKHGSCNFMWYSLRMWVPVYRFYCIGYLHITGFELWKAYFDIIQFIFKFRNIYSKFSNGVSREVDVQMYKHRIGDKRQSFHFLQIREVKY